MRQLATRWADDILERVLRSVRAAIDDRRTHPARFALFHARMCTLLERAGIKRGRHWHAWWARHYWAKAWALDHDVASGCAHASLFDDREGGPKALPEG